MMRVLGIETSCDETAAAVITDTKQILSSVVLSQIEDHAPYLGVVPEIAARAHACHIDRVIAQAMLEANTGFKDLDAVAVTAGPGLIGGVMVGLMTAKALASVHRLPFFPINHLEGHALSVRLTEDIPFPFLLLLVSGGHCQLLIVEGADAYEMLGSTLDDALGEAFDKTAKLLKLGYPGGPAVEALAKQGNTGRFPFPVPLRGRTHCNFSFSGLKTAVRQAVQALPTPLSEADKADICASFQYSVGQALQERVTYAIRRYRDRFPHGEALVVAGGVAANHYVREILKETAESHGLTLYAPPLPLCTDNAAMIAWAGIERIQAGILPSSLESEPRARWPLPPAQITLAG